MGQAYKKNIKYIQPEIKKRETQTIFQANTIGEKYCKQNTKEMSFIGNTHRTKRASSILSSDYPSERGHYNVFQDFKQLDFMNAAVGRTIYRDIGFDTRSWWSPVRPLGSGTFGDVYQFQKVTSSRDGPPITAAVKRIKKVYDSDVHLLRAIRELRIMHHLRGHPNIASLGEVDLIKSSQFAGLYLFIESMDMDLSSVLKNKQEILTEWHIPYISYQILSAIHYMHSAGIVHRDIKPNNILISRNGQVKLCDFGLARGMLASSESLGFTDREHYTDYVVTRWYRAPEIILKVDKYHYGLDIWSCGCVMAELVLCRPLFKGRTSVEQILKIAEIIGMPDYAKFDCSEIKDICDGQSAKIKLSQIIPSRIPKSFTELLEAILVYSPDERLTARSALNSPFFDVVRRSSCDGSRNDRITCPTKLDSSFEFANADQLVRIFESEVDRIQQGLDTVN